MSQRKKTQAARKPAEPGVCVSSTYRMPEGDGVRIRLSNSVSVELTVEEILEVARFKMERKVGRENA